MMGTAACRGASAPDSRRGVGGRWLPLFCLLPPRRINSEGNESFLEDIVDIPGVPEKAERWIFSTLRTEVLHIFISSDRVSSEEENDT